MGSMLWTQDLGHAKPQIELCCCVFIEPKHTLSFPKNMPSTGICHMCLHTTTCVYMPPHANGHRALTVSAGCMGFSRDTGLAEKEPNLPSLSLPLLISSSCLFPLPSVWQVRSCSAVTAPENFLERQLLGSQAKPTQSDVGGLNENSPRPPGSYV